MKTQYLSAGDLNTPVIAAQILRDGGLVAIPTETVYGLGANGLDETAVAKIFQAKGRPQDNPLILHVADAKDMERFCHSIPASAYALAEAYGVLATEEEYEAYCEDPNNSYESHEYNYGAIYGKIINIDN